MSSSDLEDMARAGLDLNKLFPSELSNALVDNCHKEESEISAVQKDALHKYRTERDLYKLVPGNPEDPAVMENHFRFYDELYFFGLLTPRVQDRDWDFGFPSTDEQCAGICEEYYTTMQGKDVPTCYIKIWKSSEPRTEQEALDDYLDTLLHEMLHCFLWLFSCRSHLFRRCAGSRWQAEMGLTHGSSFLNTAYALEKATKKLGHSRILDRLGSLADETCARMEHKMKWAGKADKYRIDQLCRWDEKHDRKMHITKAQILSWGYQLSDVIGCTFWMASGGENKWFQAYLDTLNSGSPGGKLGKINNLILWMSKEERNTLRSGLRSSGRLPFDIGQSDSETLKTCQLRDNHQWQAPKTSVKSKSKSIRALIIVSNYYQILDTLEEEEIREEKKDEEMEAGEMEEDFE